MGAGAANGGKMDRVAWAQPWPGLMTTKQMSKETTYSITNEEILRFRMQRHYEEEDHLLAALKAAARIRAQNLSETDYKRFQESLVKESDDLRMGQDAKTGAEALCVGIKDWWTNSKYAYLNQPSFA